MGLLTSADPYVRREQPGEPTVRALLDTGTERVQKGASPGNPTCRPRC